MGTPPPAVENFSERASSHSPPRERRPRTWGQSPAKPCYPASLLGLPSLSRPPRVCLPLRSLALPASLP